MWRYGEKLIRHLFKKRTESQPIRVVLESKIQADRDRSDIRVFETGVSSQRYGDYEQGTRAAAQETEGERLISIAKDYGLFIPSFPTKRVCPSQSIAIVRVFIYHLSSSHA